MNMEPMKKTLGEGAVFPMGGKNASNEWCEPVDNELYNGLK